MSRLYLELDSTYRDRSQYPYPSDFVALVSQSGQNNAKSALDPVSDAAPMSIVFKPFTTFSGSVLAYTVPAGSSGVVLTVAAGSASKVKNYYIGLVLEFFDGTNNTYKSVLSWQYLYTSGGNDYFSVTFRDGSVGITAPAAVTFKAVDPSVFSDPNRVLMFIPSSPLVVNYYTGDYIYNQTLNQWLTVDTFSGYTNFIVATQHAGDTYTPGSWLAAHTYLVRKSIPSQYGGQIAAIPAPTTTQVALTNMSTVSVGTFIRLTSTDESRRITSISSSTVTVSPGFSSAPAIASAYEILQFTRDNATGITYNFSELTTSMAVCYKVALLNLVVPNTALLEGGRAIFYPYLYVELTTISNSEGRGPNMIASNNPNATRMLFRVLVNDSNNEIISPVVRLDGNGMVQHVKIKPFDSFRLSIYLPNGNLFFTETQDYYSPASPNPLVQISALFHFERINNA